MSVAIQKIKELWKKISGDEEGLKFRTMAGMYEDLHQEEQRVLQMVVLFSWISLFLTALGLFGLAWYSVESRMKEIGLRKINGATQRQVVGLLCIRFIKWIAIALAIGLPMALYLIENAVCIPATTDCLDIYRSSFYRAGRGDTYGNLAILESGPGKSRKNYKNGLSCNIISFQSS